MNCLQCATPINGLYRGKPSVRCQLCRDINRQRMIGVRARADYWHKPILINSRLADKKRGFYDEKKFITKPVLYAIRSLQNNKCHYCDIDMKDPTRGSRDPARLSIERKSNKVGHTIQNVVLCCVHCNATRADRYSYREFRRLKNPADSTGIEYVKTLTAE